MGLSRTKRRQLILGSDEELLSRRRLGQTKLTVKPGQVGTSNATKPENLGLFEYAHLRAPLPKDLKGSEIFASHQNQPHPETYFLMVRYTSGRVYEHGLMINAETKQGRMCQRNRHVQDRISLGKAFGRKGRARIPEDQGVNQPG